MKQRQFLDYDFPVLRFPGIPEGHISYKRGVNQRSDSQITCFPSEVFFQGSEDPTGSAVPSLPPFFLTPVELVMLVLGFTICGNGVRENRNTGKSRQQKFMLIFFS